MRFFTIISIKIKKGWVLIAIYSRIHNGKKQCQYRTYYKAIDGSRKQKNSKWFDTKKEAVLEESVFIQRKFEN